MQRGWCSVNALAAVLAAGQAPAQPVPEVVVSAERVTAAERTTPVSVGVVGAREIAAKGVVDLHDLVGVVAGVVVPNGFSNQPQAVAIRGVGASLPAMSQAVGIYLDDVPLLRGYATGLWDLPDIERIEVLRGPQGTLYGQNASAGAVKFLSRDPTRTAAAWVAAAAGNRGAREARGYVNGAIGTGNLSGSLAFSRRTNDGFAWNAFRHEGANVLDVAQFRAKLRWQQGGRDLVLAVDGAEDRSDANTLNFPLNHPGAAPRVSFNTNGNGAFLRRSGGVAFKAAIDLGDGIVLRAISAYRQYRDDPTMVDFGGLEVQRFAISQQVEQRAASQELQLQGKGERASWTAGLMLVHDRFTFARFSTVAPLAAPAPVYSLADTRLSTLDAGLYAQGRYALNTRTGITAGVRAYRTRQTGANAFARASAGGQRTALVYDAPALATSASGVLPKIGIDHQFDDATFMYASIAQGAKFGGYNRAAESLASAQTATRPEKVTTYEAGMKNRYAAGRVALNVALFYNDYRDYLAALNNTLVNGVQVNDAVLLNAGAARTWGADVEWSAMLARQTRWTVSAELLRSRIVAFANPTGAAATDFVGHELPNAPRLTLATTLYHDIALDRGGVVATELSLQYLRHGFGDLANSAQLAVPSQCYVNAALAYRPADSHWQFSLRLRNLADRSDALMRTRIPALGVDSAYYNPPRTLLLSARYDF
jgi:iron complex outermembrane receptor protein